MLEAFLIKFSKVWYIPLDHSFLTSTFRWQPVMDIRRLLAFFSRTTSKKAVKQNSPFLDLPLDLVYDIFDELHLPERVLLSQTCRDLWYTLRSQCLLAIRQATAVERLECLAALGDVLPDHRLCTSCRSLHLLDPKDLPVTGYDKFHKPCPALETTWSRHRLMPYYAIAFRHVQLAIKYTRFKDIHQDYRASILQRFAVSIPQFDSMGLIFGAEPIIVSGRFILMTIFVFYTAIEPISFSILSRAHFQICPHLGAGGPLIPDNRLLAAIRLASNVADGQLGSHQEVHSCDRCPTDFRITIKDRQATLYVWQDLGAGTSPLDPYWRSHIWDEGNGLFKGTKFKYEHGSIRDLYHRRGT